MITVQKGKVSTRYITNLKSTRIYKGKTVTLKPVLDPITSQDKVTYSTSNKNIATVNSKGVVTGKQVGTAKITVKAGSKKSVVTIKVMPKVKTTKLTGVPKTKTVNRGKPSPSKPLQHQEILMRRSLIDHPTKNRNCHIQRSCKRHQKRNCNYHRSEWF